MGCLDEFKSFFIEMAEKYFLNYNIKIKEFEERILQEKEFKKLSLNKQKQMFIAMLDLNEMFVNRSEMGDSRFRFGIGEGDRRLTGEVYGG